MNMANTSQSAAPQQRRLAEFATILGDIKLAISVWETLRKDNRGGSVSVKSLIMLMKCLMSGL